MMLLLDDVAAAIEYVLTGLNCVVNYYAVFTRLPEFPDIGQPEPSRAIGAAILPTINEVGEKH